MIEISELTKEFNEGKANAFAALKNISLKIEDGEFIAITGKSGAGKSTLLKILAGAERITRGEVKVFGKSLTDLNEKELAEYKNKTVGIVMQDFMLINDFLAWENVMVPLLFKKDKMKFKKAAVAGAMKKVGIEDLALKKVADLSGGEKQRVAMARAIVNDPKIIFADEPTGSLDGENTQKILSLLKDYNDCGKTVIIVTHDSEVASIAKRKIELEYGEVVFDSSI